MEPDQQNLLYGIFSQAVSFEPCEWHKSLPYFSFHEYRAKETIFSHGDYPLEIHFVLDGIGRYFYVDKEGKERNKSLVKPAGAFSSVSTLIDGAPSPFFAQAISACSIAAIKYEDLIKLSESNANWGVFVRKLLERLILKKERREASFLLMTARERYEQYLSEFKEESHLIPLRHVAMYIGVTDVTLSRVRKEMGLT